MFDCKLTVYVLMEGWRDGRGCVMCQAFVLGFRNVCDEICVTSVGLLVHTFVCVSHIDTSITHMDTSKS